MDSHLKETTSEAPPVIPTSSSLSTKNTNSTDVGTSEVVVSATNLPRKHIIRKIIPLDPKKLQQAGLDRKIAEALSKQKSQQQSNNQPNRNVDALSLHFSQVQTAASKKLIISKSTSTSSAKNIDKIVINKLNPPKITITGPEAPTEKEKLNLANLNPQQRLVHVKNLLNKKLLEKKRKEMNDNSKTNQLLKTPQAIGDRTQQKLYTKVTKGKPQPKKGYIVLKDPARLVPPSLNDQSQIKLQIKPPKCMTSVKVLNQSIGAQTKAKTPQKSPQDIARKLDFQTDNQNKDSAESTENISSRQYATEQISNTPHPHDGWISKDVDVIPKASIMSVSIQNQYKKPKQYVNKRKQVGEESPTTYSLVMTNKAKEPQNFQSVYIKQQEIDKEPKVSLHAAINQMKLKKIDFPEVSPLKEPFPTASVDKETPLPAIDSFKKPYSLANIDYYKKPVHSTTSNDIAEVTNCLVVLENKILTEDEMIDLTELRLSSSTPRFIHPHRPIQEVVIKQEHPDDYQSTDTSSLANNRAQATPDIKSNNNEKQQIPDLPISSKQSKIIINARKLQLPPVQLADLARRIKQKTTTDTTTPKERKQVVSTYQDTANIDSTISPNQRYPLILSHQPEMVAQTSNVMYGNIYNQDHDYHDLIEPNIQTPSAESQLYSYYGNSQNRTAEFYMPETSFGSQDFDKSAVEIVDEPIEADDSFSAVDFIAALSNTSAVLSLEEYNLNASCNFNHLCNCSPIKINAITQKPMPPTFQTNANQNLLKSTIVIESSKGQQMIVTNEGSDKNDLEKVKEKIKIYHELNKQKFANKPTTIKSPSKFQNVTNTDDATQMMHSEHNIEERSYDQRFYVPEKQTERKLSSNYTQCPVEVTEAASSSRTESFGKASLIIQTPASTSASETYGTVKESPSTPPKVLDLGKCKETKDRLEPSTSLKLKNIGADFVTSKEQTINICLEIQGQRDSSVKTVSEQKLETLPSSASKQEISDATTEITKLIPETEISKSNATTSNAAVASKRISKFKKGKINLVSRNKPVAVPEKKSSDEKNEMITEHKRKLYLELRDKSVTPQEDSAASKTNNDNDPMSNANKNSIEKKTVTEQSHIKPLDSSQHTVEGNAKEISEKTEHTDQLQRVEKAKQHHQTPKEETTQNLTTEKPQNSPTVLKSQATEKHLETDTIKHLIDAPNQSIKPSSSSSASANSIRDLPSKSKNAEPVQSSAKDVGTSVTAAMEADNAAEKCNAAQPAEIMVSKEKSATANLFQENPAPPHVTTSSSTPKVTNQEEAKVVQQSPINAEGLTDLQNNMNGDQTIQKSTKLEINQVKESLVDNIGQATEPAKNLSQKFSTNALIGSIGKPQEPESENVNITLTKKLKVTIESSDPVTETQSDKSLVVAKAEKEEQNAFGLPKAITGRMKVLTEPKKTATCSEILKTTGVVKENTENNNLQSFKATGKATAEILASGSQNEMDDTNKFQPTMGLPKTSLRLDKVVQQCLTSFPQLEDLQNDEKLLNIPKIEKIKEPKAVAQKLGKVEHLTQHSQSILQTMKSAKISLIDVVKHSPIEHTSKSPILPFKKSPTDIKHNVAEVSGITTLLNQLKKGQRNDNGEEDSFQETKTPGRETTNKTEEQRRSTSSLRASLRRSENLTSPLPPKITRKRLSLRPLISDDDLEFLPENAEIKFNLTKSKQNDENKKSAAETGRKSLYITSLTKRNRYYSQTLETDVTITFDNLKTKRNPTKNVQNLETEESCHDSTQDSSFATPSKQRKKLRKTMEDIKKSQNTMSDTESEDFQRDYDYLARDCEESNEFLGFEETPAVSSSFDSLQHATSAAEHESPTKHGGLKNWLTTGKTISPTLDNAASTKRLRQNNVTTGSLSSLSTAVKPEAKQQSHLKKRWNLGCCEETDITDDTSPADDEEEINKKIPLKNKLKRDINDSNKQVVDSKTIKLNEHSFKLVAISQNCDFNDTERFKGVQESQQHSEKNTEENLAQISKPAYKSTISESAVKKSPKAHKELPKDQSLSEYHTDNECEEHKQTKSKQTDKYSRKVQDHDTNRKNVASKGSPDIKPNKVKHSEASKDVNLARTSNIEVKHLTDSEDTIITKAESRKGNRGRKSKANKAANESSTIAKQLKTSSKKTKKTITEAENSANTDVEKTCSTPINSATRQRKRIKEKHYDSSNDEGSLQSNKNHSLRNIDDLDSNSLLTPLKISNIFSTAANESSTATQQLETSNKKTKKSITEAENSAISDVGKTCSTRLNSATSKRKRIKAKHYDSSDEEGPLKSNKKRCLRNIEDLDSNSLLTPLDISNNSPTAANERSTFAQHPEISNKNTENTTAETENSAISNVGKTCSMPVNSAISKRKRIKAKHYNLSDDEDALQPNQKPSFRNIEDLDSNSLLTPLEISNISPTPNPNAKECDNKSSETPLAKTLEADNSLDTPKPKGRRGKQKNANYESNFKSRLLLITKREQLDSDEILTETSPGAGSIQCGLCLSRTQPLEWTAHLAKHYGVGWQVGQQKLNIDNRTVVFNTITNYLKNSKCSGLACRMCQKVLRSALGLLTHIEQCGHQERGECKFCNKNYAKSSLVIHLRSCKARYELETQTNAKEIQSQNTSAPKEIVGNTGRLKRHSTIKAENKLKVLGKELENLDDLGKAEIDPKLHIKYISSQALNFAGKWSKEIEGAGQASCPKALCKFTSSDINELTEHVKTCKHIKSGYICNFCRKAFKSEQEAIDHITANHQKGRARRKSDDSDCDVKTDSKSSSSESEGVDENESEDDLGDETDSLVDESSKTVTNKGNVSKTRYYRSSLAENRKEVFDGRSKNLNKDVLHKWKRFTQLNYSSKPLFTEFMAQYSILNRLDYERYLPTQSVSMKFNFANKTKLIETVGLPEKNIKWSELNRFETLSNNSYTCCFLGAPIKICSWLPLPDDVSEQFLAVVYRQDMFKYIKFSQPKQHRSIVLVFKVTQKNNVPELGIHYGFVVNDGPVHHLSFLPSGGYDQSTNRLGLVAVATVNSCIKVYSLPLNVDSAATPDSTDNYSTAAHIKLIDVKPSFLLNLDVSHQNDGDKQQEGLKNCQCLQICWSEFSEHQHIFAGFSNGFLGVWNIKNDTQQNLNRFVIDGVINYTPINYFYLGEKSVKDIALHYDTLGPRWLVASTVYRKLIVFDIKNLMNPIVYKDDTVKNILLSVDWCPVWETFLISYDDALPNIGNGIVAVNPNNVMFQHNKMEGAVAGVSQAHYTPVTNTCVMALNNGDIVFLDTKELHYDNCLSKHKFDRRAFYALDIKKLDGEPLASLPKGKKPNDNVEIPIDWVMFDYSYKEKYGLIFTPLLKLDIKCKKAYVSEKRTPPLNIIPFMRINALRCNINQQGKNLVAAGYENGFLRLVYFNKQIVFPSKT